MKRPWVPRLAGRLALAALLLGGLLGFAACLTQRAHNLPPADSALAPPTPTPPPPPGLEWRGAQPAACAEGPRSAASVNARSLMTMPWAPFRRPELGWAVYETLIAHEIGTACPAGTEGFAAALLRWQESRGVAATGVLDEASFLAMKARWQARRPMTRTGGICPDPPPESELATAPAEDGYRGTVVRLRPEALAAYRRMVAAARAEVPELAANRELLTVFSAYRSPERDAARCALEQNCNGITRAACSPHRTGLALDINVGAAPGYPVDSSADPNRLYMSRSVPYRWLVAHAADYGFANYPFEPWHWEYVGR